MSRIFYNLKRVLIPISHRQLSVSDPSSSTNGEECVITDFATVRMGNHGYISKLVLVDIRYEIFWELHGIMTFTVQ